MKEAKVPVNTSKLVSEQPDMHNWVGGGNPDAIFAQEAQGQSSFVNSETLPTNMGRTYDAVYDTRAILVAAGVKFVSEVPGDSMFQIVELPKGWQKEATDHSMWSNLVDNKGRVRASIFYKAAFYDRSAHMSLSSRFSVVDDFIRGRKEGVAVSHVKDGDNVIFSAEPVKLFNESDSRSYEAFEITNQKAREWLNKKYPDWRNPGAYWD